MKRLLFSVALSLSSAASAGDGPAAEWEDIVLTGQVRDWTTAWLPGNLQKYGTFEVARGRQVDLNCGLRKGVRTCTLTDAKGVEIAETTQVICTNEVLDSVLWELQWRPKLRITYRTQ